MRHLPRRFRSLPTPIAGLALGVASLGWCMENALPLNGYGQIIGATVATCLLALLLARFVCHFDTLWTDLKHPVAGSIVPTFAMCLMVISKALGTVLPNFSLGLWCAAVAAHLCALGIFVYHRVRDPNMANMVPSWFIPPVGIIVADITFPGTPELLPFALVLLTIGMVSYAVMLPLMLYRLIFLTEVPNAAKPTIAIMAAPASLSLAGYLSVVQDPNLLICAVLLGIAILMTFAIYFSFWKLLRLQFSPGYAAFTFPMAIGATALYKTATLVERFPGAEVYVQDLRILAGVELAIATVVIGYVLVLYLKNLKVFLSVE